MILFYQLIDKCSEILARRALEIAEFFQRNRSLRVAANMNGFRRAPSGRRFICGDGHAMRLNCLSESRRVGTSKRGQCDRTNNDKEANTAS